jgi:hypothetical protein
MDNPLTTEDVAARWRPLSDNETWTVSALLEDAWALIKNSVPDIESRIEDETLDRALVVMVASKMVIRVMRYAADQGDVDDYTPTNDQAIPTGSMYITEEDLAFLDGTATTRPVPAGSFPDARDWPDPVEYP